MKKFFAILLSAIVLLSLSVFSVSAEITNADYTSDGWGAERDLQEGDKWNLMYLFGKEAGINGFDFFYKNADETSYSPLSYTHNNGNGAEEYTNGVMSFAFYQPHHWVHNSVFKAYPHAGEVVIAWTAPKAGNVTFDIDASLMGAQTEAMNGVSILFERADGSKLADDLAVTKQGVNEGGFNKVGESVNAIVAVTFEVAEGETIYIRVNNNGKCDYYADDEVCMGAWLTYNRIGALPTPPAADTADMLSVAAVVCMISLVGVVVCKKH